MLGLQLTKFFAPFRISIRIPTSTRSLIFHGTGCSRINFWTIFPESHFQTSFHERDLKFCFTWYPTDIILCLWSGFISPRIRTFVEKRFHGLFSKKKDSKSGGVFSFLSWSWGQLPPQRKTFPTRLLGFLEKQSKIWRYGRSWTHV